MQSYVNIKYNYYDIKNKIRIYKMIYEQWKEVNKNYILKYCQVQYLHHDQYHPIWY